MVGERVVRVREAQPGDAIAVARAHVTTWRDAYAGVLPERYLVRRLNVASQAPAWQRTILRAGRRSCVLVADSRTEGVVGFVHAGPARNRVREATGEVYALYVLSDWQGYGIGKALLREAAARLYSASMTSMVVEVLEANPARFFYTSLGGAPVGHGKHRFAGTELPVLFLAWSDLSALIGARGTA